MRKIIIITGLILAIMIVGYQIRQSSPSEDSSSVHSLKLSPTYSLVMIQENGREFDNGKAKKYWLSGNQTGDIILTCNESGGIFGSALSAIIKFDPITLRGTWHMEQGGVVQGGEIHLNQSIYGFSFKTTNEIGPFAGSPPGYGQLIALQ